MESSHTPWCNHSWHYLPRVLCHHVARFHSPGHHPLKYNKISVHTYMTTTLTDKWKLVLGFEYFLTTLTICHDVSFSRTAGNYSGGGAMIWWSRSHPYNMTRNVRETKSHAQLNNRQRGVGAGSRQACVCLGPALSCVSALLPPPGSKRQ